MLEDSLQYMSQVSPIIIYVLLFLFAFGENVFPPLPSDLVIVFGATLIASTSLSYFPILIITGLGSAAGFILMYYIGKFFGENILRKGKIKFINPGAIDKPDQWFRKYGYFLILANRFLPGTRSVISFFSGIHKLDPNKTFVIALISAFLWNAIIIYLGMALGNNINLVDHYLETYSNIILIITGVIILAFVVRFIYYRFAK
ncbi:MAG: DedA family protein [Ignavibacteriales bacterium]|nr:DedA family protein [Ignavibacteriales bacterium]MCF8435939.1 DedA family protein [Ignavibacteriales bacterium]